MSKMKLCQTNSWHHIYTTHLCASDYTCNRSLGNWKSKKRKESLAALAELIHFPQRHLSTHTHHQNIITLVGLNSTAHAAAAAAAGVVLPKVMQPELTTGSKCVFFSALHLKAPTEKDQTSCFVSENCGINLLTPCWNAFENCWINLLTPTWNALEYCWIYLLILLWNALEICWISLLTPPWNTLVFETETK